MKNEKNYKTKEVCNVLNTIFNLKKITPDGNLIVYKIEEFFSNKNFKKPLKEDEIIHDLQKWGVLKIEEKYTEDKSLIYYLRILPKFEEIYKDHCFNKQKLKEPRVVRHIGLNENQYLLEINNGEGFVSFKSKKRKEGLEKETKLFKILCHLWDFRTEIKNNKNIAEESYWTTIENLKISSGCESIDATYRQIKRLEKKFKKNDLPIKIEAINEKYRLVVNY